MCFFCQPYYSAVVHSQECQDFLLGLLNERTSKNKSNPPLRKREEEEEEEEEEVVCLIQQEQEQEHINSC